MCVKMRKKLTVSETQGKTLELNMLRASCDCHGDSGCAQSLPVAVCREALTRQEFYSE